MNRFQKHYAEDYNHIGVTPGFYALELRNATLGDYLQERHKEDLKILEHQGEVKTYKLSKEELEKYFK